jgi:hypothetical protein
MNKKGNCIDAFLLRKSDLSECHWTSQIYINSVTIQKPTACCITRHTFNFMDKNITGGFNVQQSPQIALASVPALQFPRSYLVAAQRRATQVLYGFLVTRVYSHVIVLR